MELSDGLLDTLVEYAGKLPHPQSELFIAQMGGATNKVSADATAYRHRDTEFIMNVHGRWEESGDDERCIGWCRELFEATKRFAGLLRDALRVRTPRKKTSIPKAITYRRLEEKRKRSQLKKERAKEHEPDE